MRTPREPRSRRQSVRRLTAPAADAALRPAAAGSAPPFDRRAGLILGAFAVVFVTLATSAYRQSSATWDEPIHLTAGYAALTARDFRVDPSHPPLLRMWAAVPMLFMDGVSLARVPAGDVPPVQWLQDTYLFAHQFLYVDNDADRLLYAGRFMTVLLGVVLGVFLFLWSRAWLGLLPAGLVLAAYAFEPNLIGHASLVTTDLGVTCLMFGAVYFTWRTCTVLTPLNVAGLLTCTALAVVSKFSAVLLAPIVLTLLAVAVRRRQLRLRDAASVACLAAVVSYGAVWAAYGFAHAPAAGAPATALQDSALAQAAPALADAVRWIDEHRLLPSAYTQGFFYTYASVQVMPAFLAGDYSADGWWYYFPVAFLLKTPTALVLLIALGAAVLATGRFTHTRVDAVFLAVPIVVFLAAAMWSSINIGLRHILPIYPFLLLVAGAGVHALVQRPAVARVAVAVVILAWGAEFARAYPHPLTFFNALAGGPQNGYRLLADSNLGWGQALKPLKAWMQDHHVAHVNLAYFGQADPAYYGIDCTHLPGAPSFAIDAITRPRLPGYVAISATTLTGVYAPPEWRLFYAPFRVLEPVAVVGNSIRVFWVDRWPEAVGPMAGGAPPEAHRALADAMFHGFGWPERAALHYREYLSARPRDPDALIGYAMALIATDRIDDGVAALRRAVDADANHGKARLTLGKALFARKDLPGAAAQAEHAVALMPHDPEARYLLGRVRAVQGRMLDAVGQLERALQIQPGHGEARALLERATRAARPAARPLRTGGAGQ